MAVDKTVDCMGIELSHYCIVCPESPTVDEKFFAYIFLDIIYFAIMVISWKSSVILKMV